MNYKDIHNKIKNEPQWHAPDGSSLLHYAAQLGDRFLINECLNNGIKARQYNKDNESAADIAIAWGHDQIAAMLNDQIKQEKALSSVIPLPYKYLQEIRDKAQKNHINIFYNLAAQGQFDQVASLAIKNNEAFNAADLNSQGQDGDSVIFKICQRGQLKDLIIPALWVNNIGEINSIFQSLPKTYRDSVDFETFLSQTRQERLKSKRTEPKWKTPNR